MIVKINKPALGRLIIQSINLTRLKSPSETLSRYLGSSVQYLGRYSIYYRVSTVDLGRNPGPVPASRYGPSIKSAHAFYSKWFDLPKAPIGYVVLPEGTQ